MLKSIHFKNFFSFRDCKVSLRDLNALIGINGTGKSNFIKALKILKATVNEGAMADLIINQWGGFNSVFFAGQQPNNEIDIDVHRALNKHYKLRNVAKELDISVSTIVETLRNIGVHIDNNPNTTINLQQYEVLINAHASKSTESKEKKKRIVPLFKESVFGKTDNEIELEFEFDETVLSNYGYSFTEPVYYYISFKKVGSAQNFSINECFHTNGKDGMWGYLYMSMKNGQGTAREGLSKWQKSVKYELTDGTETLLSHLVDRDRYFQIYTLREAIKDIAVYGYFDTTAQSPIRKPMLPSGISRLLPNGGNLPQILNWIKVNSKNHDFKNIISSLQSINPQYDGLDYYIMGNNIELNLEEKKLETPIHVTHISDGTLRYLCLLSIVHNSQRGALVCIDEPEIGLHPDMIMDIVEAIKQASKKTQFVIATHSEHILNNLSVENVLVCEKADNNETIINTFRDKDYIEWASQYSTGKLWRDGDLGGNRY
ncbi:MAG: AAA family ATPase [Bacteroidales bacterium]|nr:AAA family ATPase [Bacteroidales bacterium]